MKIKNINLTNFRNYKKLSIQFGDKPTVFLGSNTQGKTNLLEAISYLTLARSFRTKNDIDLINWTKDFTRIEADIEKKEEKSKIEIVISKNNNRLQKIIKINKKTKKQIDLLGEFNTILFAPEDINLILLSPVVRRKYLNNLISQIDWKYLISLNNFRKVLLSRNRLLSDINKDHTKINQLDFWNEQLIQLGSFIIKKRKKTADSLNTILSPVYKRISGQDDNLIIEYLPSITDEKLVNFDLKQIYKLYKKKIEGNQQEEIRSGFTLFGPHLDDFKFILRNKDLVSFGSRGEFRSVILATWICELDFLENYTKSRPVLLLDDVFSELDSKRRDYILDLIKGQQTIITTTDLDHIKPQFRGDIDVFKIEEGEITEVTK